jgi:hypothetical protein
MLWLLVFFDAGLCVEFNVLVTRCINKFNIQQLYALITLFVCCVNSDLCHLQHKLIGFYNRYEKCLQRGTDWGFK